MTELLKIENLWKRYGLKAVIRELNIEITEGKFVGLVGDNGSEKTTLLKMIAGLQHQVHYSKNVTYYNKVKL